MDVVDECLHEMPFSWALKTAKLFTHCSFCLNKKNETRNLLRCSVCRCAHYCDQTCQKRDWADHQVECRRLKHVNDLLRTDKLPPEIREKSPEFPDDFVRLVARTVGKVLDENNRQFTSGGRGFEELPTNLESVVGEKESEKMQRFEEFVEIYGQWVGRRPKKIHKAGLVAVFGKVKTNLFPITDDAQEVIGSGLYLSLSRIEHSCDPNASIVFRGKEAVVVPTRKLNFSSPLKWAKIRRALPDIDTMTTTDDRQRQLREIYGIDCQCRACCDHERTVTMEAYACADQLCLGRVILTKGPEYKEVGICTKCRKVLHDEKLEDALMAKKLCDSLSDSVLAAQGELEKQQELYIKCAEVVQNCLHKYNIKRLLAIKGAYHCCVMQKRWQDALKWGKITVDVLMYYLGEYDPFMVVFQMNLAMVVLNAGETESAQALIRTLTDKCKHIYGEKSEAMNYIEPSLEKSIAELEGLR